MPFRYSSLPEQADRFLPQQDPLRSWIEPIYEAALVEFSEKTVVDDRSRAKRFCFRLRLSEIVQDVLYPFLDAPDSG
jgi:hypothetical protein